MQPGFLDAADELVNLGAAWTLGEPHACYI